MHLVSSSTLTFSASLQDKTLKGCSVTCEGLSQVKLDLPGCQEHQPLLLGFNSLRQGFLTLPPRHMCSGTKMGLVKKNS